MHIFRWLLFITKRLFQFLETPLEKSETASEISKTAFEISKTAVWLA